VGKSNNKISVKQGPYGIAYTVSLGNLLYNNRVLSLNNLEIPLFKNNFFELPVDKDMYSVVNVYYDVSDGNFIFDQLGKYKNRVDFVNTEAKPNVFPISQFLLKQELGSFIVVEFREFSEMATFTVTTDFIQGVKGSQGLQGYPGITGPQGYQGLTGPVGVRGETGYQGITGIGLDGYQGIQGTTGLGPDYTYLLDVGFESNRKGVIDNSPYERDCTFYADDTGGYTGWIGGSEPVTGIQDSKFQKTIGVVGSAHEVTYAGGISEYREDQYLPFSGAISCWLRFNQRPRALFSVVSDNLKVFFIDESILFPKEWLWDFGDGFTSVERNPSHTYLTAGSYVVSLKVSNENGESYRYEEIDVIGP